MGLFSFIKNQLIDIVEWTDDAPNILVHRFERHDNEIKTHAKLIVRPGQRAIFVNEGQIADQFGPGTYTLSTANMPILTTLLSLPYGFESWHKAEVYFVRTTIQLNRKWGTPNPIMMRDPDFKMLRLRAFGNYSYKVGETNDLLEHFMGGRGDFTTEEIEGQFSNFVVSKFSDALGELHIPALELASNYTELGNAVMDRLQTDMNQLGFVMQSFVITNISLPDEVSKKIDEIGAKRTELDTLSDVMDTYTKKSAADAMVAAAQNTGGGAGNMMGMMMGINMANLTGQVNAQQQAPSAAVPPPPAAPTFYVAENGQRLGPFTLDQLQTMAIQGTFNGNTQIWTAGMAGWQPASTVPQVASILGSVPPPLP